MLIATERNTAIRHLQLIYVKTCGFLVFLDTRLGGGELVEKATVRKFRTVQTEGTRQVSREQEYYNLDMIISLGYRVKSIIATQFRQWVV